MEPHPDGGTVGKDAFLSSVGVPHADAVAPLRAAAA